MQVDSTAGAKWAEAKLWGVLLSKESFVASLCTCESATEEELLALVEVVEAVFSYC
jgi:hypothetical protein